jgi:hypothetical protein
MPTPNPPYNHFGAQFNSYLPELMNPNTLNLEMKYNARPVHLKGRANLFSDIAVREPSRLNWEFKKHEP